jgi:hypothetical protein
MSIAGNDLITEAEDIVGIFCQATPSEGRRLSVYQSDYKYAN